MKGFQISMTKDGLSSAMAKLGLFKTSEIGLIEVCSNNLEQKALKSGMKYFRGSVRLSQVGSSGGATYVIGGCNYWSYDRNDNADDENPQKEYLEESFVENAKAVMSFRQLKDLSKSLGAGNDDVVLDFDLVKKTCEIQTQGKVSISMTFPLVDKSLDTALSGEKTFGGAVVKASALKKLAKDSTIILKTFFQTTDKSDAAGKKVAMADDAIKFCFGAKFEAYVADRTTLETKAVETSAYKSGDACNFFGIKGGDFRSVVGSFEDEEDVSIVLKGSTEPRFFEITSKYGGSYTLPIYGPRLSADVKNSAIAAKDRTTRKVNVSFDRSDFVQAINLLKINYKEKNLRLVLEDGDKLTIMQVKGGKKANQTLIAANIKVDHRAEIADFFDAPTGPIYADIAFSSFLSLVQSLELAKTDGKEEPVNITVGDMVTNFENVAADDNLFCMNFLPAEQFKAMREYQTRKSKEAAEEKKAAEERAKAAAEAARLAAEKAEAERAAAEAAAKVTEASVAPAAETPSEPGLFDSPDPAGASSSLSAALMTEAPGEATSFVNDPSETDDLAALLG